jgi:hypothetical protein
MKFRNKEDPTLSKRAAKLGCYQGAKKRQELYPNLSSETAKKTHQKHPGYLAKAVKKFHKLNPNFASLRNQDPNDNFGYTRNKTAFYKNIRMRSSWEVLFAKLCDELNLKWQYEPKTFKLQNGRSYTPDFYIPEKDLWIEIKPKHFQTEELLNRGKVLGINLKVLDKSNLGEI